MGCQCLAPGRCPWHSAVVDGDVWAACQAGQAPMAAARAPCIYLGRELAPASKTSVAEYECHIYGRCTHGLNVISLASCAECKTYATPEKPPQRDFVDPLKLYDRCGEATTSLRNLLNGGAAFLVCGGPSLNQLAFSRLSERGIFSLGINNVAGYVPVSAFCCSDPPSKFHSGIFADPKIIKLLPKPKLRRSRGKLRVLDGTGRFVDAQTITSDMPNVWGFDRRSWLACDDTWFTDAAASWGNLNEGVEKLGAPKTACTMLLGLRLLQYLGARQIFLLGVDFYMSPAAALHDNYAFGEARAPDAVQSNNRQYSITCDWLTRLRPVFERWGFYTYNCNQLSHLRAFDYVPFDQALEICRGRVPREPFNLVGWYAK